MRNPLCILAVCMVWLFVEESLALSKSINTLRETERLAEHLNRGAFTVVQNVAKTVEPFFSVFSSVIQMVVDIRSATSPSAELEYLHQLSDSINQKFDEVNSQFNEVKKLIQWTSVQATYASLEANIHAVSDQFKLIFKVPPSGMNQQKQIFINSYESTYQDSGSKLFAGFMLDTGFVSQGLLRPAMHYTENNRGEMRTFMLGIMKLLILGANVELGYMTIKGYDNVIPFHSHQWQVRFEQVQEKMKEIDLELKNKYQDQAIKDIDTFSNKNFELSNPMFGRFLYQELSKKYFWRNWLVVVSTHTDSNHDAHSRGHSTVKKSTKKQTDPVWRWENIHQEAFEKIKDLLVQPPVLAYADYSKPFIVHTDSSSYGLGAVLYQKQGGVEKVIAYASRGLRPAERNYPAHKLEFLALKCRNFPVEGVTGMSDIDWKKEQKADKTIARVLEILEQRENVSEQAPKKQQFYTTVTSSSDDSSEIRQMKAIEDVPEFISFLNVVINTLLCQSCTIPLVVREHRRCLLGLDLLRFLLARQSLVHLCQSGEPTVFANLQIDMGSGVCSTAG
uniref:Uncharacterized protein LOC111129631 n=1 Tax=Crassostrea virginica TaxID=6565 RepID=A0A8B8DU89_CRAVI|nr:uncharacterized protein LOC111129631 [Crassostrea virginica]